MRPKKQKVDLDALAAKEEAEKEEDAEESEEESEEAEEEEEAESEEADEPEVKKSKKNKRKREDDEEKELEDIENRYMEKILTDKNEKEEKEETEEKEEDSDSDNEEEAEAPKALIHESLVHESLVHESLANNTEVDKAESTVFIGNLPSIVITEKPKFKELKTLLASKGGKVKSVRFRSIAFSEMLPRKAAFVKHKFHSSRETVNAYAVFDKPEHARAALALNGTVFADHHLRVDSVAHPGKQDNKRTIFVGNLDFEGDEEPLWRHFSACGEIEYVRIVRDSKTNVGKGFGYVQFTDPVAVTKALMLDGQPVDDTPRARKLRVSRSKNIRKPNDRSAPAPQGPNSKRPRLTNEEKTKLGRAKSVVGKAGRAEIQSVLEGTRASKGDTVRGIKNGGKRKKPRIRERSTAFKRQRKAESQKP